MEIELVPEPGPDDPALRAAFAGIEQTGLAEDAPPAGSTSAWRRAGVLDAVDRDVTVRPREVTVTEGAGATPQPQA